MDPVSPAPNSNSHSILKNLALNISSNTIFDSSKTLFLGCKNLKRTAEYSTQRSCSAYHNPFLTYIVGSRGASQLGGIF